MNRLISGGLIVAGFGSLLVSRSAANDECSPYVKAIPVAGSIASDECFPYKEAIFGRETAGQPLPDPLLTDWKLSMRCIVGSIAEFETRINDSKIAPIVRAEFLTASGGIRSIFASSKSETEFSEMVKAFRCNDNSKVATVLSFGARSNSYEVRLNSMILLGNVIDNTTVCIAIDHLYSRELAAIDAPDVRVESYGTRGRANLLSTVSVVAPWAFRENFENISKIAAYWDAKIPEGEQFKDTKRIIRNIKSRLDSQTLATSNKNRPIPEDLRACKSYPPKWASEENWVKY